MTPIVWTYIVYIALSIPLTVWVAQTLHKNGRVFLVDSFRGNERLADSVNHLLVVGFYLINIGYVALALKGEHRSHGYSPSARNDQSQDRCGDARAWRHAFL